MTHVGSGTAAAEPSTCIGRAMVRSVRLCLSILAAIVAIVLASASGLAQSAAATSPADQAGMRDASQSNWLAQGKRPPIGSSPTTTQAADDDASLYSDQTNNGEDFTRPLNRFDLRYKYEQTTGSVDAYTLTLRNDCRFDLPGGWELATRVDLPVVRNNKTSSDNPDGDYEGGLGNLLTQALLITPHVDRLAAGGGMRVTWPTVTEPQLGNQKYVLGPTVGGVYYPRWLREGSLIGALTRYEFSVGGSGAEIERLVVQPLVNINLPASWFVNFQPELTMNCRQDNRWFMPFDMMVGKKFTAFGRDFVASLEWKQGLLKDYAQYDWSLEFRIGFFF